MPKENPPDTKDAVKLLKLLSKKLDILIKTEYKHLPKILREKKHHILQIITKEYILISFLNEESKKRIDFYKNNNYESYPGLIRPKNSKDKCAYTISNSINTLLYDVKIQNIFSICLGSNSTIIIENLEQKINLDKLGTESYVVDLCYIISFGDIITKDTIYDYFDKLLSYHINFWRSHTHG